MLENDPDDQQEKLRLLQEIGASEQCLEIYEVASEVSS
jgi:hypothetical protein